jgi:hypothetical protein
MGRIKKRQLENPREDAIQAAIRDYRAHKFVSLRKTAAHYGVPLNTLSRRLKGALPPTKAHPEKSLLTPEQEEAVVRLCLKLDGWGHPLKLAYVKGLVLYIKSDSNIKELGDHWITRFLNRHPIIASKIATRVDRERATANDPVLLAHFFKQVFFYSKFNAIFF